MCRCVEVIAGVLCQLAVVIVNQYSIDVRVNVTLMIGMDSESFGGCLKHASEGLSFEQDCML